MLSLSKKETMTQDEKWKEKYNEILKFLEEKHRNPSKYAMEDRNLYTWLKYQRKIMNAGKMKPERIELFKKLLVMCEQYKRKNQYE